MCYQSQTQTVDRLSAQHQTVLATFLGFFTAVQKECATPPHVQVRHWTWLSFTRPSPMLVLQVTNAGVRKPGYEAISFPGYKELSTLHWPNVIPQPYHKHQFCYSTRQGLCTWCTHSKSFKTSCSLASPSEILATGICGTFKKQTFEHSCNEMTNWVNSSHSLGCLGIVRNWQFMETYYLTIHALG